jgi:hypothetical protein
MTNATLLTWSPGTSPVTVPRPTPTHAYPTTAAGDTIATEWSRLGI